MKRSILLVFIGFSFSIFSQTDSFNIYLKAGKAEFKKDWDSMNYSVAVNNLEKAVKIQPKNAEAHYFLGYAYSRLNSLDGKSMINADLHLTKKSSNEFEIVNKLTPKYSGEYIVLDPYSKITSEWGSLAMSYWHNNKVDSSIWAFKEGKKRGGFSDFILTMNKLVLDRCDSNSILVSSGDNYTIPLWYLQIVNGYRKDISVVDVSLLNTIWYPKYLSNKEIVQFDLPEIERDSIQYCKWHDSLITIGNFSWIVKPSYYEKYLLRGDRIFLSLLRKNNFKREIYFTAGFTESSRLSLQKYLLESTLVDKLNYTNEPKLNYDDFKAEINNILPQALQVNRNSSSELIFLDNIRLHILNRIVELTWVNKKEEARELLLIMDKYLDEKKYPYQDSSNSVFEAKVRKKIK